MHDAGSAVGQGGFGGVWGAKNLKAISVLGTKGVKIADPQGLIDARLWAKETYAFRFQPIRAASRFLWFFSGSCQRISGTSPRDSLGPQGAWDAISPAAAAPNSAAMTHPASPTVGTRCMTCTSTAGLPT